MSFMRVPRAGLRIRTAGLEQVRAFCATSRVRDDRFDGDGRNTHFGFRTVRESDKESLGTWLYLMQSARCSRRWPLRTTL